MFDDTVVDKNFSHTIELVRRQYGGNAHGVIKGVGVVPCVYVNPALEQFWIIDYRIYDPAGDGQTQLDHVHDMLLNAVYHKQLAFHRVLMDTWYATKDLMVYIEQLHKTSYCPLKDNRLVDDSGDLTPYRHVATLDWTRAEPQHGKLIKLTGFPQAHKVHLFRGVLSPQHTGLRRDQRLDSR